MFVITVGCSFSVVIRVSNTQSSSKQFQTQWHILYKTVMVSAATAVATATAVGAVTAALQYLNQYLQCVTVH
jgi:TRAP-type mannitol/chloroaromatic compound transport system permease small subunit